MASRHSLPLVLVRAEEREAGRVAYVTVNNPGKRNSLGIAGKKQLAGIFRKLAGDKTLRAAILTGAGDRSFIAGADIAEMRDLTPGGAKEEHTWTHRACDAIRVLPVAAASASRRTRTSSWTYSEARKSNAYRWIKDPSGSGI